MKIAVIGGTGFIGHYLVRTLESAGHDVSMLVRSGSENKIPAGERFRVVTGGVDSADALDTVLRDCDAVVYSVGILREVPKQGITFEALQYDGVVQTVAAAKRCGVERVVLISANGARQPGTAYQETKFSAERHVFSSGMQATVFRPSVVFGDPGGRMEIATQLYRDMVNVPYPAIGFFTGLSPSAGAVMMSPVHVEDLAAAVAKAIVDAGTVGKTIEIGGPEALSWTEMIRRVSQAAGRNKWILPMPIAAMYMAAMLLDWLPFFPVTRDQLTMLAEGNTAPSTELESLIGRPARPFTSENLDYLGR